MIPESWLKAAIAKAKRLGPVAPYFIDAGPGPGDARQPIGGLTILSFPNNHLQYALTWFLLALCLVVIYVIYVRSRLRAA